MYLSFGGTSCLDPVDVRHVVIEQRRGGDLKTTVFIPQSTLDIRNFVANPQNKIPQSITHHDFEDIAIIRIYGTELDLRMPWDKPPQKNPRHFLNKLCYKSLKKVADNGFYDFGGSYVYVAGYGTKGTTEGLDRTPKHELTWTMERAGSGHTLPLNREPRYWVKHRSATHMFYLLDDTVFDPPFGWSGRSPGPGDSGGSIIYYVEHGRKFTADKAYASQIAESRGVAVGLVGGGLGEYERLDERIYENVGNSTIRRLPQLTPWHATNLFRQLPFIEQTLIDSAAIGHEGPPEVRSSDGHPFYRPGRSRSFP